MSDLEIALVAFFILGVGVGAGLMVWLREIR